MAGGEGGGGGGSGGGGGEVEALKRAVDTLMLANDDKVGVSRSKHYLWS